MPVFRLWLCLVYLKLCKFRKKLQRDLWSAADVTWLGDWDKFVQLIESFKRRKLSSGANTLREAIENKKIAIRRRIVCPAHWPIIFSSVVYLGPRFWQKNSATKTIASVRLESRLCPELIKSKDIDGREDVLCALTAGCFCSSFF